MCEHRSGGVVTQALFACAKLERAAGSDVPTLSEGSLRHEQRASASTAWTSVGLGVVAEVVMTSGFLLAPYSRKMEWDLFLISEIDFIGALSRQRQGENSSDRCLSCSLSACRSLPSAPGRCTGG